MMDETTLNAFPKFIVTANEATCESVSKLTAGERRAYQRVKAAKLLLEQEKIPHAFAVSLLARLLNGQKSCG